MLDGTVENDIKVLVDWALQRSRDIAWTTNLEVRSAKVVMLQEGEEGEP